MQSRPVVQGIYCSFAAFAIALATACSVCAAGDMNMAILTEGLPEIDRAVAASPPRAMPFSFTYGGVPAAEAMAGWKSSRSTRKLDADRTLTTVIRTDPVTGLRLTWEVTRFRDFPAVEWVLWFANTAKTDTPIIADVQALDVAFACPMPGAEPYRLHRTNGAPANPTDFEPSTIIVKPGSPAEMGGGGGRSSNRDLPFIKLETGAGSFIVAVGWSGQWRATLDCADDGHLRLKAGLERTHFRLHSGERVRTPRILVLQRDGDTLESNALFRQLVFKHYAAPRSGKAPLPSLFSNTCFTRGGGWLNECNAENQISLINAYAPMGLEAVITDAGWFEGGWPDGAGNWTPRKDAYPNGMAPVAAAAKNVGMAYGLWFEPERVVAGTSLHREHPDWLLTDGSEKSGTLLADFGRPEVRAHFLDILRGFMKLPGFRVYRQDFNMDPLPYWRNTDAPDRQGITEMHYIEGLYDYWDSIAREWPDSLREECASGGRRIDLETLRRMHFHQTSDYWFDDVVNQARDWSLSRYLPNSVLSEPVNRVDTLAVHSAMAASLCIGWIADAPDFDQGRAKALAKRYLETRRYLVGAWYPLTPYSRDSKNWLASQYHLPRTQEGMVLAFRRPQCATRTLDIALHGLEGSALYEWTSDASGKSTQRTGAELMRGFPISLPEGQESELGTYHRIEKG